MHLILLLVGSTVCRGSFLPTGLRTFIWWKNPPKCCTILVWIAGCLSFFKYSSPKPESKDQMLTLPHFLGPVWRKRLRFVNIQPVIPTSRRIRCIFVWSGLELWSLFKNSRKKFKNQKPIVVGVLFRAYPMVPWYHSHADPIWPDGTFKHFIILQSCCYLTLITRERMEMRRLAGQEQLRDSVCAYNGESNESYMCCAMRQRLIKWHQNSFFVQVTRQPVPEVQRRAGAGFS